MPSIIEGYNYDIFISYRQKDNKGDQLVSEFVEALKTELETTIKEEIRVNFDENPHDRLEETHNVDKSLKGKPKCLLTNDYFSGFKVAGSDVISLLSTGGYLNE